MSLLQIGCPGCGASLKTRADAPAVRTVRCPKCGVRFSTSGSSPAVRTAPIPTAARRPAAPPPEPEPPRSGIGLSGPQIAALLVVGCLLLLVGGATAVAFALVVMGGTSPVASGKVTATTAVRADARPVLPPEPLPPAPIKEVPLIPEKQPEPPVPPPPAPPAPAADPNGELRGSLPLSGAWFTVTAPKPLSDNVKRGLMWLASKQHADGGWGSEEGAAGKIEMGAFGVSDTGETPTVTESALATLALLRSGSSPTTGEYSNHIVKGIDFLCGQVEKSAPNSPFVTDLRDTIVQTKMGQHFDTYVAAWALSEAADRMPNADANKRVKDALAKVIAKIETTQRADGAWFDDAQYDAATGKPSLVFPGGGGGLGGPPAGGGFLGGAAGGPAPGGFVGGPPPGMRPPARQPNRKGAAKPPANPPPAPPMGAPPGFGGPGFGGMKLPALAPVLGQAMAVKGMNRARQAGLTVDDAVLQKAKGYAQKNFDATTGELGLKGSFGIVLYASASHLGAMQDSINTRKMLLRDGRSDSLEKDIEVRDQAFKGVVNKLNDRGFLLQFGSYGGEDFLGYMLLSEAMAVKSDDTWKQWDASMTQQLNGQQNGDGSWTGHHCTTGRTFCTASVVLVLAADRTPVPLSVLRSRN